ncbi:MAG: 2-amino-4-ketopentanoate thiolase [Proteobacteria bacterium]|nr:2-amino-4-ketopentanoate thiolase [Pseudomonadota bacterium]MBU1740799.1 2-amino-4-ketopentanoate thiolase [Pseudomonadota bacterium]
MNEAFRGDLVQIINVIMEPADRPETLPPSTRAVPYQGWIKGLLVDDHARIGDQVTIKTFIGRHLSGKLYAVGPTYDHGFGRPRPELLPIGALARKLLGEDG